MDTKVRSFGVRSPFARREFLAACVSLGLVLLGALARLKAEEPRRPAQLSALAGRRLAEREERVAAAIDLRAEDRLDEAIAALGKALAIERETLGGPDPSTSTWERLVRFQVERGDFRAAREVIGSVLSARGKEHWQSADARRVLADLVVAEAWDPGKRKLLRETGRLAATVIRLRRQEKTDEALRTAGELRRIRERLWGNSHPEYGLSLYSQGVLLRTSDPARARPFLADALQIFERRLGQDHPLRALCLFEIGILDGDRGDLDNAAKSLRGAAAVQAKALGKENRDTIRTLGVLSQVYRQKGEPAGAELLLRELVELNRKLDGTESATHAESLLQLGWHRATQGDLDGAMPLLQQAADVYLKAGGKEQPGYVFAVEKLGLVRQVKGDRAGAETLLREALALNKKVFGAASVKAANAALQLGGFLSVDRIDEAIAMFQEAADVFAKGGGKQQPCYVQTLEARALLFRSKQEPARAEALLGEALPLNERLYGKTSRPYAKNAFELGSLRLFRRDLDGAVPLLRAAVEGYDRAGAKDGPEYLQALELLALVYDLKRDWIRAESAWREALERNRTRHGPKSPQAGYAALQLGSVLDSKGDNATAEPLLRQAVEVLSAAAAGTPDRDKYRLAVGRLNGFYESRGDYARAEPLAREDLRLAEEASGRGSLPVAQAANNLGRLLVRAEQYDKAEAPLRLAADVSSRVGGKDHPEYLAAVRNLGQMFEGLGDVARAEPLLREVVQLERTLHGEESTSYAKAAFALGSLLVTKPDYVAAEPLLVRAAATQARLQGKQSGDYLSCIEKLGILCQFTGSNERARDCWREAVEIARKLRGEDHAETLICLASLGRTETQLRNFDAAEKTLRKLIELRRRTVGEQHVEYGMALNDLGSLYTERKDYGQARTILRQSLDVLDKAVGRSHPDYEIALVNLASVATAAGDVLEARDLWEQVAAIEQAAPAGARRYGGHELELIGSTHIQTWDFAKAEASFRGIIELQKGAVGEKHPRYADALASLAHYYMARWEPGLARPLLIQAARIKEEALGKDAPGYALALVDLAKAFISLGEYDQAEPRLAEARPILDADRGNRLDQATCLGALASLYDAVNDDSRAEQYLVQSIAVLKEHGQDELYLTSLGRLAAMYQGERKYDEAGRVLNQVLELRRQRPGDQRLQIADLLQILSQVESESGRLEPAGRELQQATEIVRAVLGKRNPRYAYALETQGYLAFKAQDYPRAATLFLQAGKIYHEALGGATAHDARCQVYAGLARWTQGELTQAEAHFRQALVLEESRVGKWHPAYAEVLDQLARLKRLQKDGPESEALARQALDVYRRLLDTSFGVLTERQQLAMTRASRAVLDHYLSIDAVVPGRLRHDG